MSVPLRLLCISVLCLFVACRGSKPQQKEIARTVAPLTVGFYNVENLFDTKDNPDKIDEDFTPEGKYKWTEDVYAKKRANIAKAIASMGPNGPDLLGLAEVENARVVQDLLETEPLKGRNYAFLHAETPDMRGIDNAFVYDADKFKEVSLEAVEVDFPEEPDYTSRKILVVSGKWNGHPLHIMVNHWPSRWGGAEASEPRRFRAATVAREAIDRLLQANPEADIILMGDLNDDPFDRSVTEVIRAQQSAAKLAQDALFNATYALHNPDDSGTL
ncbi:MAG: endonuclease/exonuclease/phosphatase family protein, partial [Bacteroidota bacterium]